jgi:DNA-binding ferritin-like protein (Dps family)
MTTLRNAYTNGKRYAKRWPDAEPERYKALAADYAERFGAVYASLWLQGVVTTYWAEPAHITDL